MCGKTNINSFIFSKIVLNHALENLPFPALAHISGRSLTPWSLSDYNMKSFSSIHLYDLISYISLRPHLLSTLCFTLALGPTLERYVWLIIPILILRCREGTGSDHHSSVLTCYPLVVERRCWSHSSQICVCFLLVASFCWWWSPHRWSFLVFTMASNIIEGSLRQVQLSHSQSLAVSRPCSQPWL